MNIILYITIRQECHHETRLLYNKIDVILQHSSLGEHSGTIVLCLKTDNSHWGLRSFVLRGGVKNLKKRTN